MIRIITNVRGNTCHLCGEKKELRPYGNGGTWICFDCAMKDEASTKRNFSAFLSGDGPRIINTR